MILDTGCIYTALPSALLCFRPLSLICQADGEWAFAYFGGGLLRTRIFFCMSVCVGGGGG